MAGSGAWWGTREARPRPKGGVEPGGSLNIEQEGPDSGWSASSWGREVKNLGTKA